MSFVSSCYQPRWGSQLSSEARQSQKIQDLLPDPDQFVSSLNLPSKISLTRKKELIREVQQFINTRMPQHYRGVGNVGRVIHGLEHLYAIPVITGGAGGFSQQISLVGVIWGTSCDHMIYQAALKKSKDLVRYLQRQGIESQDELEFSVQAFLRRRGGVVHSNWAIIRRDRKIKRLAQGENVRIRKSPFYIFHQDIWNRILLEKQPPAKVFKRLWRTKGR